MRRYDLDELKDQQRGHRFGGGEGMIAGMMTTVAMDALKYLEVFISFGFSVSRFLGFSVS
jgi:hypothetical protein